MKARYTVNEEHRQLVRRLAQLSHTWPTIAVILRAGEKTLRKYYGPDYVRGRAESGTAILAALHRAAVRSDRPSVEAAKALLARLDLGPPATLGKKEAAEIDAINAEEGTEWASLLIN